MLRKVDNASFERIPGLIPRYRFVVGALQSERAWSRGGVARLQRQAEQQPVAVLRDGERTWWLQGGEVVVEREGLEAGEVATLLRRRSEAKERRRGQVRAASSAPASDATPRGRDWIALEVRRAVWERDGGVCSTCGSGFDLQYDHVIPVALGGSSRAENLQVLCGSCNRAKGARIA